jgi:signal transduction histidine kinase/CheY-like chemotaxis protein
VDRAAVPESDQSGRSELDLRIGQLTRDLADAIEQQSATSEILRTIGSSTSELGPVFQTVLQHAVRLCGADAGLVFSLDDDVYRVAATLGGSDEYRRYLEAHPVRHEPGTLVGRVVLERRAVHIADAAVDPRYQWREARELGGFHTLLGVPMLADDRVVGVIVLWRSTVDPFDERTIGLLNTFAAQAVIAIRNGELVQELQERERQLARSVGELEALGEISQAVSSTLDLDEVLMTIVTRAAALSRSDGGTIYAFDADRSEFFLRACVGTSDELVQSLRDLRIPLDGTFIGEAAALGEVRQAPDLDAEPSDPHVDMLRRHGWRSMVAVPLRREEEIIGALIVRHRRKRALSADTVELLETMASQSTVAIHNARVFRELEQKSRELEIASQHKSEFLASMSHELRTPLNAVIGFSDVLLDRMFGELNERQDEYVRDIRNAGRHLLDLINEILDLSKVEAGRMELELDAVLIDDLVEHAVALVRQRAAQHGLALNIDIDPELGAAYGDELRLRQVVVNLLSNAVKFTPDGGTVTVIARRVDDEAHISVRDTGIGVAAADQERIFAAFQSGGRSARASVEGTGLGLTLSKQIVELHGGRVWMESEVGAGSTFSFSIPLLAPVPAGPAAATPAGGVLVVEDDRYTVTVARDGVEGLDLARRLDPAVVILDILLPRLNGWELIAQLKGDPRTAATPVVIVSMIDEQGAGFALGADEYLVKPVDRARLLDALSRCTSPPHARQTLVAIDDDPTDLDLLEAVLAPNGWSVVRAKGGEEGVRAVLRERPAVVVLDLLMPDLDGFSVVEQLRADPLAQDVPIVVLTSKDMTRADHERLSGQISFLAQKGTYQPAELVDLVGRVAASHGADGKEAT